MRTDGHLAPRPASSVPLSPVDFLGRAIEVHADRPAVVWADRRWTYDGFGRIVARLARDLADRGVGRGDVVSVMTSNRPELLAAHYAVPLLGAVLNAVNTRLDVGSVAYILEHADSALLLHDRASSPVATAAARHAGVPAVVLVDPNQPTTGGLDLLADEGEPLSLPAPAVTDEWEPICLNYTSGTTGRSKGVVYTHRGAYLNAIGNVLALGLSPDSTYLWTLPMFHCNGWCHTWAVTAAGGTHVCLDRPAPELVFRAIDEHAVTHMACAPVVLYTMLDDDARLAHDPDHRVLVATGGAAPTPSLIERLDELGFDLLHLYGLTESYGPATMRALADEELGLPPSEKAALLARQGFRHPTAGRVRVVDERGSDQPADGEALGEIVLRGNTLMAGYHRDLESTDEAFRDGWFHTGDLGVLHPDGSLEIKDRSKDIVISGGENISTLEIEAVLHEHPAVQLAAVVAGPHERWGETPCAFVELRSGMATDGPELREHCRRRLAGFKVPTMFVFGELPKTATGKIQKYLLRDRAAGAVD
jgi:fatty-acyl-CoA synthase